MLENDPKENYTRGGFLKIQDEVKTKSQVKGKFLFMQSEWLLSASPHYKPFENIVPLMNKKSLVHRAEKNYL